MKRILFALIILSGIIRINAQTLIPSPEQLIMAEGYFELDDTPIRIYVQDKRLVPMSLLRTEVLENADIQTISRPNKADIRLRIEKGIPAEGYRLSITSNYMEIKAADKAGFVYAFQTLRQLREKNKNLWKNVSISDRPRTKWRGFMLDSGRQYQSVATIKKYIDMASMLMVIRWYVAAIITIT